MYISYRNARLAKICTSEKDAKRALPTNLHVESLFRKIQQLGEFKSLADVPETPPFRRHKLEGKRRHDWGIFLVNKTDGLRICFSAVTEEGVPSTESDLKKITCIQIDAIEDYHG
jgi:plasmid maintenance system killer protein